MDFQPTRYNRYRQPHILQLEDTLNLLFILYAQSMPALQKYNMEHKYQRINKNIEKVTVLWYHYIIME